MELKQSLSYVVKLEFSTLIINQKKYVNTF